ncbi:MAG: flavodoxin domain-containing protein [Bacteroidales bacterium]|nr:flavodoxin domain-containing protein [Bacteroidales bacterium]
MKILVTYASRTGSTAAVAARVGRVLTGLGEDVIVSPMSDLKGLKRFDAVIAGSSVQSGLWLPEAMEFIRRNQDILQEKPFAIFSVSLTPSKEQGVEYRMAIMQWTAPVRALAHPVSEAFFAAEPEQGNNDKPGARSRFKLGVLLGILKERDNRQLDLVVPWAVRLHDKLK